MKDIERRYYKSVKRFSGKAFRPSLLRKKVGVKAWNENEMFRLFDEENTGSISPEQLRRGIKKKFGLTLKQHELEELCREKITLQSECTLIFYNSFNVINLSLTLTVQTFPMYWQNASLIFEWSERPSEEDPHGITIHITNSYSIWGRAAIPPRAVIINFSEF